MQLIMIQQQLYWQITAKEHTYNSQHETIMADLNCNIAKTFHLLIILMDDAIRVHLAISMT